MFVTFGIPEGNNVTLVGKIAGGRNGSMAMIGVGWCKGKHIHAKNGPRVRSQDLKKPEKPANLATTGKYRSAKVSDLRRPSRGRSAMPGVSCSHLLI